MRSTAPSPAALIGSQRGLSPKTVHEKEPVRSPSSRLRNALPLEAVLTASFLMTTREAKVRPAMASSALSSRTVRGAESAIFFDELGVAFEEGVGDGAQEGIKDGLAGQDIGAGVAQSGERVAGIVVAAGCEAVAKEGDGRAGSDRIDGGLVNAHGRFEATDQEVFGAEGREGGLDAVFAECGK